MKKLFKECNFVEVSNEVSLMNFVLEVLEEIFPQLVRFFYANLIYSNGVLSSKVKKHPIWLSVEEFAQVCNLFHTNQVYDGTNKGNELNYVLTAHSFFINQTPVIHIPFTISLIHMDIWLICHTINHVLLLRNGNSSTINITYIPIIWFLVNIVEKIGLMWSITW